MKNLFIARHGEYGYGFGYPLSSKGKEQADNLGKRIKEIHKQDSIYIVTSPALRTRETAEIIATNLDSPISSIENLSYLWEGSDVHTSDLSREDVHKNTYECNPDIERLLQLVEDRRKKAEGLIVVSHKHLISDLAEIFIEKEFGRSFKDDNYGFRGIEYGEGMHFDLEQEAYQGLP